MTCQYRHYQVLFAGFHVTNNQVQLVRGGRINRLIGYGIDSGRFIIARVRGGSSNPKNQIPKHLYALLKNSITITKPVDPIDLVVVEREGLEWQDLFTLVLNMVVGNKRVLHAHLIL